MQGEKRCKSIRDVITKVNLSDGMTISFHHCLREGDRVISAVLEQIRAMGIRDLKLAPSAIVNISDPVLTACVEEGVITSIEASGIRGLLGNAVLAGALPKPVILRSHGSRPRAISEGTLAIDVAFIAASAADSYGNCTGQTGKSAFGAMGYAMIDAHTAKQVVIITDQLVDVPCTPVSISGQYADAVVCVDSIGDPALIATGAARVTRRPADLRIARSAVDLICASRRFTDGFSFQTGASAISIAATAMLAERMRLRQVQASFALGGITQSIIDMYDEGLVKSVLCSQSFDADAARAFADRPGVTEIDNAAYAGVSERGSYLDMEDFGLLGALEVDTDFNVNLLTGATGTMLGGLGGGPDVAACAYCPVIVLPVFRGRIPCVVDRVQTVCTPGAHIAAVVTQAGTALNPRHKHYEALAEDLLRARIPLTDIHELRDIAYSMTGVPARLKKEDSVVCYVEDRDGSILDKIYLHTNQRKR